VLALPRVLQQPTAVVTWKRSLTGQVPDGELDRQRWWVECKGRTETVERGAVQQAALDASARVDVDILVIATNSRFSNPTRDWVAERARSYPRPIIKLWDRDNLTDSCVSTRLWRHVSFLAHCPMGIACGC
jgi:hypothetical protein